MFSKPDPDQISSASSLLRDYVTLGVSLRDDIKVSGKLPKPNSAIMRSTKTPYGMRAPEQGGFHIHLFITVEELGEFALRGVADHSKLEPRRIGSFLSSKLCSSEARNFFDRRLHALLRDGEIKVFRFEGSLPKGKRDDDSRVPYLCFEFRGEGLGPDPQGRSSQFAHAIRRLNAVFEHIGREGPTAFQETLERREKLELQLSREKLPVYEFESLREKLHRTFGFRSSESSLTFDQKPRLVEQAGGADLRLSYEPGISHERRESIYKELESQLRDFGKFVAEQLEHPANEVVSCANSVNPNNPDESYVTFSFHPLDQEALGLDTDQALSLVDTLYDDFIEAFKPYEAFFTMRYD